MSDAQRGPIEAGYAATATAVRSRLMGQPASRVRRELLAPPPSVAQPVLEFDDGVERPLAEWAKEALSVIEGKYRVSRTEIVSDNKQFLICLARDEYIWRLRTRGLTFEQIGRRVGGRDHTSILAAVRRYDRRFGKLSTLSADAHNHAALTVANQCNSPQTESVTAGSVRTYPQ